MDAAPLTAAHSHARLAVQEAQKAKPDLKAATAEHELAAGEFATAKDGTQDSEALRILTLLEQHHRRLAHILQSGSQQTASPKRATTENDEDVPSDPSPGAAPAASEKPDVPLLSRTSSSPTRLRRNPHRELSSSIASNLATARGKPSAQRRPFLSVSEAPAPQIDRTVARAEKPARQLSPESHARQAAKLSATNDGPLSATGPRGRRGNDEGFQRFFTSFEGLFSKLSAPLAFAGLPLTAEEAEKQAETIKKPEKPPIEASEEPNLGNIYSKAALRAIREDGGSGFGIQDSFYWVQPTGGTVTYANMLSGRERDHLDSSYHAHAGTAHVPETIEEDGDEFVDARESQGPPSPRSMRGSGGAGGRRAHHVHQLNKDARSAGGKTMEELELENNALREVLDMQSQRLAMWEASSQSQFQALTQSMRRHGQPAAAAAAAAAAPAPGIADTHDESGRLRELEELLRVERAEKETIEHRSEKLARENEKLLGVVGRYREKWEVLKAGARRRDRNASGGQSSAAGTEAGDGRSAQGAV